MQNMEYINIIISLFVILIGCIIRPIIKGWLQAV